MGRRAITDSERIHGERLGQLIAETRQQRQRSAPDVARVAAVSIDAMRSLEMGRVPTPSFLTIARIADALELSLDDLHARASQQSGAQQ